MWRCSASTCLRNVAAPRRILVSKPLLQMSKMCSSSTAALTMLGVGYEQDLRCCDGLRRFPGDVWMELRCASSRRKAPRWRNLEQIEALHHCRRGRWPSSTFHFVISSGPCGMEWVMYRPREKQPRRNGRACLALSTPSCVASCTVRRLLHASEQE